MVALEIRGYEKSELSPRSVEAVQIELERLPRKGFVKQMSFKSRVK